MAVSKCEVERIGGGFMKMKTALNDEIIGGAISIIVAAIVAYLLVGYAGVSAATAAVISLVFVGGLTYAFYRLYTKGHEAPGMTSDEIDASLTASALFAAVGMAMGGLNIKELFTNGLIKAAEAAASGGTAATATPASSILVIIAQYVVLTMLIFGGVYVLGQKIALWLSERNRV